MIDDNRELIVASMSHVSIKTSSFIYNRTFIGFQSNLYYLRDLKGPKGLTPRANGNLKNVVHLNSIAFYLPLEISISAPNNLYNVLSQFPSSREVVLMSNL